MGLLISPIFVNARFTAVDPKREFSNPYSYVGNNPVMAIDPNGEAIFFMQGTWQKPLQFDYTRGVISRSLNDVPHEYRYPKKLSVRSRKGAARHLFNAIKQFHEANPDEVINLVGQSHGGNVFLNKVFLKKVRRYNKANPESQITFENVVLLNTPIRKRLLPDYEIMKNVIVVSIGDDPWQKAGGRVPGRARNQLPANDQVTNIFVDRDVFDNWYKQKFNSAPNGTDVHMESALRPYFWEKFVAPYFEERDDK